MSYKLRILSLGAGVQSTTLLLMAERGEIEPFHCAIFADTGWEGQATYDYLSYLESICKTPIIKVSNGNIREHSMVATHRRRIYMDGVSMPGLTMPCYALENGKKSLTKRQCTSQFKLDPIRKEERRMLGLVPRQRATRDAIEQVVGISLDEKKRMRISEERMTVLSYPLVYMGIDRHGCEQWLMRNGFPVPPKSSCVGCPFHSDHEWRLVKQNEKAWKEAIELDERIKKIDGFRGELYLHKSCKPLAEVDLRTPEERGQLIFNFDDPISLRCKEQKLNIMVNGLAEL